MAGLTTRNQTGTPTGDENAPQNQPQGARTGAPGEPLPTEQVISEPLIETPNPNDAVQRNPGDPTISLNADGSVANTTVNPVSMTVPVDAAPHPSSDPAHVPSPYQPEETSGALEQKETARLREEAVQAENRFRPNVPGGTWQPGDPGRRPPLHEMADQPAYGYNPPDPTPDLRGEEPEHEKHKKHNKKD